MRRRIARALQAWGACSWEGFSRSLYDPGAQRVLTRALTVTLSLFWRNGAVFRYLQQVVLPEIMRGLGPGEPLIAWSAGTASGQEAYSLAMAASGLPEEQEEHRPVYIIGSDLDAPALRRSSGEEWTRGELKEIPPDLRDRFFSDSGGTTALDPLQRRKVILIQANLWESPPLRYAHLVLCRNAIMTYFHGAPREEAMERIVSLLSPGGWLVLGRKEHLPKRWAARWGLVHAGRRIYRRGAGG
ncbi:hypothetical protein JXA88_11185 [Candidatus Fermentibacteria bacterium]|nr:hypothetical protein [Candidatus Fermentibacteria bacterium]